MSTNAENWWKDFLGHLGRSIRNKPASTGTDDLSFLVKLTVNDINEVVKGFLIAAEEKERDVASKKVIQTIEVAANQASKNEVMTARMLDHQGNLTSVVYKQVYEENQKQLKLTEV